MRVINNHDDGEVVVVNLDVMFTWDRVLSMVQWWSSFHVVEGDVNVLSVIVSLLILSVVDGH